MANKYSRIFHHISTQDLKRNMGEEIRLKKIEEGKKLIIEAQQADIQKKLDSKKSNWRDDLNPHNISNK